jgi:hypothetical protein
MCQHASFFFLSWHRMYIYFFERILRAASGDPNLALPYWNYSDPAQRALGVPFREPAGANNLLFVSQRNAGINAGAELLGSDVSTTQMFLARNFLPREGSRLSFGGGSDASGQHFSTLRLRFRLSARRLRRFVSSLLALVAECAIRRDIDVLRNASGVGFFGNRSCTLLPCAQALCQGVYI